MLYEWNILRDNVGNMLSLTGEYANVHIMVNSLNKREGILFSRNSP